jgi:OOP family OmpA-OmpF porin
MNIIGHADPLGQPGPNERLSMDRANTVQQYLAQAGLGNVRMSSEGRGSREPVVNHCGYVATPQAIACNAPNRRVVIDIAGARR